MKNLIKKEILVGVIVAIVMTIFFEPIIKWLWSGVIQISALTFDGFLSRLYRNAAMGKRNYIDAMFFMYFVFGTITIFILQKSKSWSLDHLLNLYEKIPAIIKKILTPISTIIFIASALYLLTLTFSELQLNTSFEQRLTALAPSITEQEYLEIKASWAIMDSRSDFLEITSNMEDLAEQHDIDLPKLLLK